MALGTTVPRTIEDRPRVVVNDPSLEPTLVLLGSLDRPIRGRARQRQRRQHRHPAATTRWPGHPTRRHVRLLARRRRGVPSGRLSPWRHDRRRSRGPAGRPGGRDLHRVHGRVQRRGAGRTGHHGANGHIAGTCRSTRPVSMRPWRRARAGRRPLAFRNDSKQSITLRTVSEPGLARVDLYAKASLGRIVTLSDPAISDRHARPRSSRRDLEARGRRVAAERPRPATG